MADVAVILQLEVFTGFFSIENGIDLLDEIGVTFVPFRGHAFFGLKICFGLNGVDELLLGFHPFAQQLEFMVVGRYLLEMKTGIKFLLANPFFVLYEVNDELGHLSEKGEWAWEVLPK